MTDPVEDSESWLSQAFVHVVDDDASSRVLIKRLLEPLGCEVVLHPSAAAFLSAFEPMKGRVGCLVCDLRMPEVDGLELQRRLNEHQVLLPVVFVSAAGQIADAVQAMHEGACDFLEKPLDQQRLITCVRQALERAIAARDQSINRESFKTLVGRLTVRERQVMELLAAGVDTKEIGARLGISPKTVFVHRARTLDKLGVDNLVQLSRLVQDAK